MIRNCAWVSYRQIRASKLTNCALVKGSVSWLDTAVHSTDFLLSILGSTTDTHESNRRGRDLSPPSPVCFVSESHSATAAALPFLPLDLFLCQHRTVDHQLMAKHLLRLARTVAEARLVKLVRIRARSCQTCGNEAGGKESLIAILTVRQERHLPSSNLTPSLFYTMV